MRVGGLAIEWRQPHSEQELGAVHKVYISANELLSDSFKLAAKIYASGYRPDLIVGVWRGGAPVAIAVQEYFDYMGVPTAHMTIKAASYTGIDQQQTQVRIEGLDQVLELVGPEDRMLIIDDVFDSGRTISSILEQITAKSQKERVTTIRVGCPWFKPNKNLTATQPDYYLYETDDWLVFPHELKGLTKEEIQANKGELASIILPRASKSRTSR